MGRFLSFFFVLFVTPATLAQGSLCGSYDVANTHPDEIRTNLVIKCMRQGDTFFLDGPIDMELIFELKTFATTSIKKLYLNSTGGRVDDGFEVAEFIRDNNIQTIVRKGAKCLSVCTLLFQAGTQRTAHPEAQFMYHNARFPFQSSETIKRVKDCQVKPTPTCSTFITKKTNSLQKTTDALFSEYIHYGASVELYQDYKKRPEDPDWIEKGNYLKTNNWYMMAEETMPYQVVSELTEDLPDFFYY